MWNENFLTSHRLEWGEQDSFAKFKLKFTKKERAFLENDELIRHKFTPYSLIRKSKRI